jgi:hypothetical protein
MPPPALISVTASSTPLRQLVPTVAPAPDSSMMLGILIVSCATAGVAAANVVVSARRGRVHLNPPGK